MADTDPKNKIKRKIAEAMQKIGYEVRINGEGAETEPVKNSSVGDGESKRPDVEGLYRGKVVIRGEAKTEDELDTEDSITRYELFTEAGYLILGVPEGCKEKVNKILEDNLSEEQFENVEVGEY